MIVAKKRTGFTLLEVILAISLLLMISQFFLMKSHLCNYRSKKELDLLVSNIETVRSANMNNDKSAKLKLKPEEQGYTVTLGKIDTEYKFEYLKLDKWTLDEINFYQDSWTNGNTVELVSPTKRYFLTVAAITGRTKAVEVSL